MCVNRNLPSSVLLVCRSGGNSLRHDGEAVVGAEEVRNAWLGANMYVCCYVPLSVGVNVVSHQAQNAAYARKQDRGV